jgi:hypothetical protein
MELLNLALNVEFSFLGGGRKFAEELFSLGEPFGQVFQFAMGFRSGFEGGDEAVGIDIEGLDVLLKSPGRDLEGLAEELREGRPGLLGGDFLSAGGGCGFDVVGADGRTGEPGASAVLAKLEQNKSCENGDADEQGHFLCKGEQPPEQDKDGQEGEDVFQLLFHSDFSWPFRHDCLSSANKSNR